MPNRTDGPHRYDDIIELPHHVSGIHPRMSLHDRAAQFAPFSALSGHGAAIRETARLTDRRIELTESETDLLNEKLMLLQERIEEEPSAEFTWFVPDTRKEGGSYITRSGRVKKFLPSEGIAVLTDGYRIPLEAITEIRITEETHYAEYDPNH